MEELGFSDATTFLKLTRSEALKTNARRLTVQNVQPLPIAHAQIVRSLEQAAVHEEPALIMMDQVLGAGHHSGRA